MSNTILKNLGGIEDLLIDATLPSEVSQNRLNIPIKVTKISADTLPYAGKPKEPGFKSIKTKIDEVYTLISTNKQDISTNKQDISTNKQDISTNKQDISTNKQDIAILKGNPSSYPALLQSIEDINTKISNVDNTSDLNKPVSTAQEARISEAISNIEKGIELISSNTLISGKVSISVDNPSEVNITNGIFIYTDGLDANGYIKSSEKITGSVDFSTAPDGINYVYKEKDAGYKFTKYEPSFSGLITSDSSGVTRLVSKDGEWYNSTNGALGSKLTIPISFLRRAYVVSNGIPQYATGSELLVNVVDSILSIGVANLSGNQFVIPVNGGNDVYNNRRYVEAFPLEGTKSTDWIVRAEIFDKGIWSGTGQYFTATFAKGVKAHSNAEGIVIQTANDNLIDSSPHFSLGGHGQGASSSLTKAPCRVVATYIGDSNE